MSLTLWERRALLDMLRERDCLAALEPEPGYFPQGSRRQTASEYRFLSWVKDAGQNIVAYDPGTWLGRPVENAESQACRRACGRLEAAGLIERLYGPDLARAVAVRLTPEGERVARYLAERGPDPGQSPGSRAGAGLETGERGEDHRGAEPGTVPPGSRIFARVTNFLSAGRLFAPEVASRLVGRPVSQRRGGTSPERSAARAARLPGNRQQRRRGGR